MTTPSDAVPVPGPDTPTWTIDDDGDLVHSPNNWLHGSPGRLGGIVSAEAWADLQADVRAARVHEGCGPASDTPRLPSDGEVYLWLVDQDRYVSDWAVRQVLSAVRSILSGETD